MQQPMNRRTFAAALVALTAGQIARPLAAQAQPEPVPIAPGIELLPEAPEVAPFPPVAGAVILALVTDYDELRADGSPKMSLMVVAREGTEPWHLDDDPTPTSNHGLRLDDDLLAAFERIHLASKSM